MPAPSPSTELPLGRRIAFALTPTLVLVLIFLAGFLGEPENSPWLNRSALWGPGDPFYAEDPSKAANLSHPLLIWRPRPHFAGESRYAQGGVTNVFETNEYGLRDDPLQRASARRVLNLGDSATWGLNLRDRSETYSDQLQALLPDTEIVNAGVVGYSTLQGLQFLRLYMNELSPEVVTVYLGNNDPAPGGLSDAQRVGATAGPLHARLSRNFFYLLLQKGVLSLRATLLPEPRTPGQTKEPTSAADFYANGARVSPAGYAANLRAMVTLVREAGARIVLIKVPMNLVWPPKVRPYGHRLSEGEGWWTAALTEKHYLRRAHRGEPACRVPLAGHPYLCGVDPVTLRAARTNGSASKIADSPAETLRRLHNAGITLLGEKNPEAAIERFKEVLAGAERCACVHPRLLARTRHGVGIAQLLAGRTRDALATLRQARTLWPFAMSPDYEREFDAVVTELEVEWIDLPRLFAVADPAFAGSALIHDWVHPDREGNRIIAEALAERLR